MIEISSPNAEGHGKHVQFLLETIVGEEAKDTEQNVDPVDKHLNVLHCTAFVKDAVKLGRRYLQWVLENVLLECVPCV